MGRVCKNKYVFLLLILLCIRFPVYADTLSGDESGKAAGQTSVTARVELPEDYEPGDPAESDGTVHTGDDGQVMAYVSAILLSIAASGFCMFKTRSRVLARNPGQ